MEVLDLPSQRRANYGEAGENWIGAAFRPEIFLEGEWAGWGVLQDRLSRRSRRYVISGSGQTDERGRAFRFAEHYAFEDGETDDIAWAMHTDDQGHYGAKGASGLHEARGLKTGHGYRWKIRRVLETPVGPRKMTIRASVSDAKGGCVIAAATVRYLGLRLATMTTVYRTRPGNRASSPGQVGEFPSTFSPMEFFDRPTTGAGVISSAFGRVIRKCVVKTSAEYSEPYDAQHFDEHFIFDDGAPDDILHWAIQGNEGNLDAAEPTVVGNIKSVLKGPRWEASFRRRLIPPLTGPLVRYKVLFTQLSRAMVLKQVKITLAGVTLVD
jgi:hypothetical protein